jgi:hypothetical protein
MNVKHLAAAAIAALGLSTAFAQEATPDTWTHSATAAKSRAEVVAETTAARAHGELEHIRQYDIVTHRQPSTLTRAEVLADLQLWQRAGLSAFGRGQASADVHAPGYRAAYARYEALRASPEYDALVATIAAKGATASL